MPKFCGETGGSQTEKFVKVFSLKGFPLYTVVFAQEKQRNESKAWFIIRCSRGQAKSVLCQYVSPQNFASRYLVPWGKVSAEVIQEAYACLFHLHTLYMYMYLHMHRFGTH